MMIMMVMMMMMMVVDAGAVMVMSGDSHQCHSHCCYC
jgi:hypothetical protein